MRSGWGVLLALGLIAARPAAAQVSAYVELGASKLTNLVSTNYLVGPTIGLTADLTDFLHMKIAADVRGNFFGGSQRLDGIAVGPRVALQIQSVSPYAEVLVGFARYNDGQGTKSNATTDAQLQVALGVDKRITRKIDWRVFEFGYQQYYALGGQFNPKTFSTGFVLHLGM